MNAAVEAARRLARPGGGGGVVVVLLSPAAPSYGAYRDFVERGDHFRELVERGASSSARGDHATGVLRWNTGERSRPLPTRHISFRVPDATFERLDRLAREGGQPRSRVANELLEEGLRMADHPGIVFRSGPTGRRPGLARGPDVWEVCSVFRQVDAYGEAAIAQTAELKALSEHDVRSAVRYYAEHRGEIDAWIDRVQAEADRAEAAWRREQHVLG